MGDSRRKLLLVDDEPDMLDFLERVLRRDFLVHRVNSAIAALQALDDGDFEILITDHKMPKMSGGELLARITETHPHLVRILLSGYTEMPTIEEALRLGRVHNYAVKPIDSERLFEAISTAISNKNQSASATD